MNSDWNSYPEFTLFSWVTVKNGGNLLPTENIRVFQHPMYNDLLCKTGFFCWKSTRINCAV